MVNMVSRRFDRAGLDGGSCRGQRTLGPPRGIEGDHGCPLQKGGRGSQSAARLRALCRGYRITTVDVDFDTVQGAGLYADNYRGHARMVVDLDREILLGVTFVGPGVSELLHSATVAVAGQVPVSRLRHAIACFPTVSEIWLPLLASYRPG